jgi:hypothetical protein
LLEQQAAGPPTLRHTDPALAALTAACLQHRPEARPRHAGQVAAALRAWLDGDPKPALALAPAPPAASDAADAQTRPMPIPAPPDDADARAAEPRRERPRRRTAVAAVGVFAIVLAIGAAGFAALAPTENTAAGPRATPLATPVATPSPAWAGELADRYRAACGTGPSARELAALGRAAAEQKVDAAVAICTPEESGKGHGNGKGKR